LFGILEDTMTWVVGTPTPFGYATGISDIRATWTDGRALDGVQKIHHVGPDIAAAFAGSVRLGFALLDDLRTVLGHLEDPGRAWKPRAVALVWRRRARRIYRDAPERERKLGAQIMLLGVSPRQNMPLMISPTQSIPLPGLALATVAIMRSPQFEPHWIEIGAIDSIGSGSDSTPYVGMLRKISMEPFFWESEMRIPTAYAKMARHVLQQTIERHPEATVSPHVHLCIVGRGAVEINGTSHVCRRGGEIVELPMPAVATTWAEFEAMHGRHSVGARTLARQQRDSA